MTETNPFVSVIVPVYNDPEGIRDCLTALSEQSYPDDRYEVIVVDNGSTDSTRSVISEFPVTFRIEDEIQGSYAARNTGIANAHGDVFGFVDADCTPEPNCRPGFWPRTLRIFRGSQPGGTIRREGEHAE